MPSTSGARFIKSLMGLALVVAGAAFTFFLWHSYQRAEETRRWPAAEAVIIFSEIMTERPTPHSPLAYRADIRYRYSYEGKSYTGTHVRRVEGPSNKDDRARQSVADFPVGQTATCYVNPQAPDFAILRHETRAALYSIWFPLLFVAGGAGMIWSAWRRS